MTSAAARAGVPLETNRLSVGVGIVGAGLAALIGIWPPATTGLPGRIALTVWIVIATSIAVVDVREHRIPNRLVGFLSVFTLGAIAAASALEGDWSAGFWLLVWAVLTVGAALCLHVASAGSLGMGDVKLAFPVALLLGWYGSDAVWTALLVTPVLASVVVGYRSIARLQQEPVPLAPFILAGGATALLAL